MQIRLSPAHPESDLLSMAELEERIRNRAYDLYEQRGCVDGKALDDWLEAKAEVLGVVAPPNRTERKSALTQF
jgi:Protein of unknown function (DUF2934)